eukprot:3314943-Pleurochrysis_carterae.AAC.3
MQETSCTATLSRQSREREGALARTHTHTRACNARSSSETRILRVHCATSLANIPYSAVAPLNVQESTLTSAARSFLALYRFLCSTSHTYSSTQLRVPERGVYIEVCSPRQRPLHPSKTPTASSGRMAMTM